MADKTTKTKTATKKKETQIKSNKKKITTVVVFAVIVGFVILVMNVSNLAKAGVEKIASNTLGVKVSIAKLDISLQDKKIEVSGLHIGNPDGYKRPHALTVDTIRIVVEGITPTLLTFNEIAVVGTTINMEVAKNGTNMTDIRKNMDRKASTKKPSSEGPIKLIIKRLNIESATLNPTVVLAGGELPPVTMPNIRLTGIGQKSNGVLVSEAIGQILDRVTSVATQSAAESGFMRGMNADSLKNIQQSLGLPSGVMDQVKGFGGKIKGIFGN